MTASFSDPLLRLVRPHLAWVCEQLDLFTRLVPVGTTAYDPDAPTVTCSGVTVRGHLVGSYASDGTWLWAWGNERFRDTPGAQRSAELRALGVQHGIPELTERLVDLNGFDNPRVAADHLLLISLALLDGRGGAAYAGNESTRFFVVVDDPAVPRAEPRAAGLVTGLENGAALLPGPALKPVQGWFKRHGIEPEYAPGRVTGTLPTGDRVVVTLDGDRLAGVRVTGPDGGAPRSDDQPPQRLATEPSGDPRAGGPSAEDPRTARPATDPRSAPTVAPRSRMFPRELLGVAAREIGFSIRGTRAMVAYAGEHLGFVGQAPRWDERAGRIAFPGGGLAARRLGAYDLNGGWFAWAEGTEDVRAALGAAAGLAAGAELPELSGRRLDLGDYLLGEKTVVTLARVAASAFGGIFTSLGNEFWVITDAAPLEDPEADPDVAAQEVMAGASWLGDITDTDARPETMRAMATAYFERLGYQVMHHGQPEFLSGMRGLYEVRVYFAPDGTVTDASPGMAFMPQL